MPMNEDEFEIVSIPQTQKEDEFEVVSMPQASLPKEEEFEVVSTPDASSLKDSGEVTPEEVKALAQKHGVDEAELRKFVPYYGVTVQGEESSVEDIGRQAAGSLGRALPLNVVEYGMRHAEEGPMRAALDELKDLGSERRTWLRAGAEQAAGAIIPLGIAGSAVKEGLTVGQAALKAAKLQVPLQAALGAVSGGLEAKKGQEVEGALIGGAVGGVLGGVLGGGIAALGQRSLNQKTVKLATSEMAQSINSKIEEQMTKEAPEITARFNSFLDEGVLTSKQIEAKLKAGEEVGQLLTKEYAPDTTENAVAYLQKKGLLSEDMPTEQIEKITQSFLNEKYKAAEFTDFANFLSTKKASKELKLGKRLRADDIKEAQESIQDLIAREGKEYVEKEFMNFRRIRLANEELKNQIDPSKLPGKVGQFMQKLFDGRVTTGMISERSGLPLDMVTDSISQNQNKSLEAIGKRLELEAKPILKEFSKLSKGPEEAALLSKQVIEAIEQGKISELSAPLQSVATKVQQFFDATLNNPVLKELGINIAKRDNYIPAYLISPKELLKNTFTRINKVEQDFGVKLDGSLSQKSYTDLLGKSKEFRELMEEAHFFGKQSLEGSDARKGMKLLAEMTDPSKTGGNALETMSRSMLQREGEIPASLRETDLGKLMQGHTTSVYKHAFMRNDIGELNKISNLLRAQGDIPGANYVNNQIQDIVSGYRANTLAAITQDSLKSIQAWGIKGQTQSPNLLKRPIYKLASEAPEILHGISSSMYSTLLGLNPRAIVQNLSSTFFMTAPEIGESGTQYVARGWARTMNQVLQGQGPSKKLAAMGLSSPQNYKENLHALGRGISEMSPGLPKKALDLYTKVSMVFFEKSEQFNKLAVVHTAELIIEDAQKGLASGVNILNKLPTSYQEAIKRELAAGNTQKAQQYLGNLLVSKTIFHYNKATMSQFGRSMGPLFTAFTKYPLSIAGDMYHKWTNGEYKTLATKYLGPLAIASLIRTGWDQIHPESQEALFGKKGLTGVTAISTLNPLMSGKILAPIPALGVKGVAGTYKLITEQDPSGIYDTLGTATKTFVPGSRQFLKLLDE